MKWAKKQTGFTIVELLIVVVVIAILATITIVGYNGIQRRAITARLQNTISQAVKKVETVKQLSVTESYPVNQAAIGMDIPSGITFTYHVSSVANTYCVEVTESEQTFSARSSDSSFKPVKCIENGLAGWWQFNGNANDSSGNGLNGAVTGATLVAGQSGQASGAYNFDGVDDTINFGNSALLTPTARGFTVSAWFKRQGSVIGEQAIIRKDSQYQLGFAGSTTTRNLFGTNGGTTGWTASHDFTQNYTLGTWYHGAFVWDGTAVRSYVDGVLVNTRSVSGSPVVTTNTLASSAVSRFFSGQVDDIRIYQRALSDSEASALYIDGAQ